MKDLIYIGYRSIDEIHSDKISDAGNQFDYEIIIARTEEEDLSFLQKNTPVNTTKINLVEYGHRVLKQARVLGLCDGVVLVL